MVQHLKPLQNEQTQGISIPFLFIQNDVTAISDMNVNNNLDITASGVLTMNSGKTLNMGSGANLINLGTLAIEGTLTDQRTTKTYGGTVRYSASSGSQIVVGGNYANLELSGNSTKSFDGNAQISGNFSVTGGDVTPPSSITFNGSSTQSLAGLAYNNIAFSNGGNKNLHLCCISESNGCHYLLRDCRNR